MLICNMVNIKSHTQKLLGVLNNFLVERGPESKRFTTAAINNFLNSATHSGHCSFSPYVCHHQGVTDTLIPFPQLQLSSQSTGIPLLLPLTPLKLF